MEIKKYPLRSELDIYKAYLKTVNWMRKVQLSNKEIEVAACFMMFNNKYKDLDPEDKRELLLSKRVKDQIKEILDMKPVVFDNYFKALRDKGIIKNGEIVRSLQVYPVDGKFTFKITYDCTT